MSRLGLGRPPSAISLTRARPNSSDAAQPDMSSLAPCFVTPSKRWPVTTMACVELPSPGMRADTHSCRAGYVVALMIDRTLSFSPRASRFASCSPRRVEIDQPKPGFLPAGALADTLEEPI